MKKFTASIDLATLNLKALNLTEREMAVHTSLTALLEFKDMSSFKTDLEFKNTRLTKAGETFPVKVFKVEALSSPDNFNAIIKSDMADGNLSGNVKPTEMMGILQYAYRKYLGLPVTNEAEKGKYLSFRADFFQQQNILQQLIPGLEILKIKKLEGTYQSNHNEFTANIEVPAAVFLKTQVDSLLIAVKGENDSISMNLALNKIAYDNLRISNISIREQLRRGVVHSVIKIADSTGTPSYYFSNQIELFEDGYKIRFLPGGLLLDGISWDTAEDNFFQKKNDIVTTLNFNCKSKEESIGFFADEKIRKFVFSNFEMKNLANMVDYKGKKNIINGLVDGEVGLSKSVDKPVFRANFAVNNLSLLDSVIGDLSCNLSTNDDRVDIDAKLSHDQNSLILKGNVSNITEEPELDLEAVLSLNNLSRLEKFSFGQLSGLSGKLGGEATIKGTRQKPDISGYLNFENTIFKINTINFVARLKDGKINISTKGFHFKDFVIEDSQAKNMTVNGDIFTDYKKDYSCNLHIETKDFHPVNSTSDDNPRFFGKLALDSDIKLSGELKSPKIEADVKINSSTNLTYALPGSELKLVTSEGIVKFRDASHLNDSLMLEKQGDYLADSIISKLTGIDLSMNLEIDPEAKFRVDIDPESGDYLAISGTSKLNISLDVSGKQSMTGIFEVKSGNYQLSFYGMVKKNFTIMPGSTVTWSGRPLDAEVNITAEYVVRSSSVALVANETSGMSETEKNVFKTRLPYEIRLIIRGFPTKPDIKFELALSYKYLMTYPVSCQQSGTA